MPDASAARGRTFALGALVFLLMVPETLPVPVLRALVLERYLVSDAQASLFMVANMAGALCAAPLAGWLGDRFGRRRVWVTVALLLDGLLMYGLAHAPDFASLLLLRALEGASHITALSLVIALAADAAAAHRGRTLGMVGAGLTLGVATGATLGGMVGRRDPVATLLAASVLLGLAGVLARWLLPRDPGVRGRPGFRTIVRAIAAHHRLRLPLFLSFVDRFVVGFYTTCFPLMLAGVHGVERWKIGAMLGLYLYPFALLSYPCGKLAERWSPAALAAVGSFAYGLSTMAVGLASPGGLWLLMPVLGIASAMLFVPSLLMTVQAAPDVGRSTAVAAFQGAGSCGFLLGPLAGAALVACADSPARGYVLAFGVAGLAVLASGVALLPALRRASA